WTSDVEVTLKSPGIHADAVPDQRVRHRLLQVVHSVPLVNHHLPPLDPNPNARTAARPAAHSLRTSGGERPESVAHPRSPTSSRCAAPQTRRGHPSATNRP